MIDLSNLPSALQESTHGQVERFQERLQSLDLTIGDRRALSSLPKVFASSRFVAEQCTRRPEILVDLIETGDLFSQDRRGRYRTDLLLLLEVAEEEADLHRILRRFRNREMVRIAWNDIAGWLPVEDILCDLSLLAESCIQAALDWLFGRLCSRLGAPLGIDGQPQPPLVIAMGKLGGWELNFSSDIDLIFAYENDGILEDRRGTSYQEFYLRLCRDLVKALNSQTEDGFVFRVDTRLRPFGESGPLVMSFDAMDIYYQSQARDWERYAMIKARPVAGDPAAGKRWLKMLEPFVYRRYLDYRMLGSLRDLKLKIMEELKRRDRLEDIKLGPGGIREIEFIAQVFQLIRGGQEPLLRDRRVLVTLPRLAQLGHIGTADADLLIKSYRFLRLVENRLQEFGDHQTQQLPADEAGRLRLAYSLDERDWQGLDARLKQVRGQVQKMFEQVFALPDTAEQQGPGQVIWREAAEPQRIASLMAQLGFEDPAAALASLTAFKHSRAIKALPAQAQGELDRLLPALIEIAAGDQDSEILLQRLLKLIESIASRTAYLTLLAENPKVLQQLAKLVSASPWIANLLARQPVLLDELLDPRTLYTPLTRNALEEDLRRHLAAVQEDDQEGQLNALRHFKQAHVLRVAAADIVGAIPTRIVSDYLTEIAEVVLNQVAELAWQQVTCKHGLPPGADVGKVCDFAIIGYGKLGGIELGYSSDLDLVFLFQGDAAAQTNGPRPLPVSQFFIRLGQRIIHMMTTSMLSGVLYEIDMRLRPSGNAGLLVSSLEAFERYQHESAWVWEHQALVRARWVAGDRAMAEPFQQVRMEILCLDRDPEDLRRQVKEMRQKMREHLDQSNEEQFDLKQGVGGMVDIEFIVQFGCLLHAKKDRSAFHFSDNLRLLDALAKVAWLTGEEAQFLQETYLLFREQGHRLALQDKESIVAVDQFVPQRQGVQRLWQRLIENNTSGDC